MQPTLSDLLQCDHYQLLQVNRDDVNKEEVKRKYREMMLKYHPDRNNDPLSHQIAQKLNAVCLE